MRVEIRKFAEENDTGNPSSSVMDLFSFCVSNLKVVRAKMSKGL